MTATIPLCDSQVVQFLLSHVDKRGVYQALMLAINLGHDEIAEMIIEHPVYEEISSEIKVRLSCCLIAKHS